ncbi:MAG: YdcF family protein [Clostridia bacterium]|nr:YdcF family protein [Clostridia bacterium]
MAKTHEKILYIILSALSLLCAGACCFLTGARFGAFFFFCFGAGMAILAAAAVRSERSRSARIILRVGRAGLVCWLISFIIVEGFIISGEKTNPEAENASCIIVLGTGVNGYTPSLCMVSRLSAAYDLLLNNPEAVAVLSGGRGEGEFVSEAQAMHDWLIKKGIDEGRLYMEDASRNTIENMDFSKALIKAEGICADGGAAVVTNEFHLWRSCRLASLRGIKAYGVSAETPYLYLKIIYHIREYFSVTGLIITGRLF